MLASLARTRDAGVVGGTGVGPYIIRLRDGQGVNRIVIIDNGVTPIATTIARGTASRLWAKGVNPMATIDGSPALKRPLHPATAPENYFATKKRFCQTSFLANLAVKGINRPPLRSNGVNPVATINGPPALRLLYFANGRYFVTEAIILKNSNNWLSAIYTSGTVIECIGACLKRDADYTQQFLSSLFPDSL